MRKLLPVKNILNEYIGNIESFSNLDIESFAINEKNNLEKLVSKELSKNKKNNVKTIDDDYSVYTIGDSIDKKQESKKIEIIVEKIQSKEQPKKEQQLKQEQQLKRLEKQQHLLKISNKLD